jgi:pyruvate dehydrogenase E2 component (dihydrolipoamide acetyltransferase)
VITEITMPKIGYTMETGTIVKWFKQEGDQVSAGEVLLEISSDKANMEVESPVGGFLKKIAANEFDEVPVLQVIGYIGDLDDSVNEDGIEPEIQQQDTAATQTSIELKPVVNTDVKTARLSPRAKKFARENEMSAEKIPAITGTGVNGLIVERDLKALRKDLQVSEESVESVVPVDSTGDPDEKLIVPSRYKLVTAKRLTQSIQEVPQFTVGVDVDTSALNKFRGRLNEKAGNVKVSITTLLVKCVAKAISENMNVNVSWRDGKIAVLKNINIGIAVAAENGLVVPVINAPDKKGVLELASELKIMTDRAKAGKLTAEEMTGGTFTISNLGMFTVDSFRAIINPPESAILAVGRIVKKPVVTAEDQIMIKPMMWLNLTSDHRVLDGADAARLIESIKLYIEFPEMLIG